MIGKCLNEDKHIIAVTKTEPERVTNIVGIRMMANSELI